MLLLVLFSCALKRSVAKQAAETISKLNIFENQIEYALSFFDIPNTKTQCVLAKCEYTAFKGQLDELNNTLSCAKQKTPQLEWIVLYRYPEGQFGQISSSSLVDLGILQIHACSRDYLFFSIFPYVYNVATTLCVGLRPCSQYIAIDVSYLFFKLQSWRRVEEQLQKFEEQLHKHPPVCEFYKCEATQKLYYLGSPYTESVVDKIIIASYFKKALDFYSRYSDKCSFKNYTCIVSLDLLNYVHREDASSACNTRTQKRLTEDNLKTIQDSFNN